MLVKQAALAVFSRKISRAGNTAQYQSMPFCTASRRFISILLVNIQYMAAAAGISNGQFIAFQTAYIHIQLKQTAASVKFLCRQGMVTAAVCQMHCRSVI